MQNEELKSSTAWKELQKHFKINKKVRLKSLFKSDKNRFKNFSIIKNDFLIDFSKNHITKTTLSLFEKLFKERNLEVGIKDFFEGKKVNYTENRKAMHYLLRGTYINNDQKEYKKDIDRSLNKIKDISDKINSGKLKGYTGKKIKNIINIGIGGSDLGPKMVCDALKFYSNRNINSFFISNIDPTNLSEVLLKIDHENSIFIISSKSFSTIETLINAKSAKKWFITKSKKSLNIKKHFFAVTTNIYEANQFGIKEENIFPFFKWVGGRYSLWSPVGLPISIQIGFKNFKNLLLGAHNMDKHFFSEPFKKNIPMILASIGIWYNNFFKCETQAIFPYDEYLNLLPSYLQQTDMESNGKSISKNNKKINYESGPILWGDKGTNGQHAFFQLIHQGTKLIPCDFIGFVKSLNKIDNNHDILISNLFGQTKALMQGKSEKEVLLSIKSKNILDKKTLVKSKSFQGNKPSNTILINKLTPKSLGSLISLYEHKIFVQGYIWGINSFDQWGVELGKELANEIFDNIKSKNENDNFDKSTQGLIKHYKKLSHK